ncbi:glycoside hydrolase family 68 protein [Pseudoduganella namucuonensis]|uniref:Beta-fructofuranosidase n=1 Tax=Pseudoduganella namucuonensis TaxID=1035707 RepID=A0A1I7EUY1_9BURK|nr:glycoside hydrolase family 68 protein [Pseudoduganella namucuonensis]SFU27718.1 beta-fructofuranosidase [Pseudoduganella namucuonensis]
MTLKLDNKYIWDFWHYAEGGRQHLFMLQADRAIGDPNLRHWNVSIGHAVSRDLREWDYQGTVFGPSASPGWDDFTTWTGSVIRAEGAYHLFYTGTCRAENGLRQRIGHAVADGIEGPWTRVDAGLGLGLALDLDERHYEEHAEGLWHDRAWRDPWVLEQKIDGMYHMFFTARRKDGPLRERGVIGHAVSPDLLHWEATEPVYAGGHYGQLEVPQVFERDGRWYCTFCNVREHWSDEMRAAQNGGVSGTHYLVADNPLGPWRPAEGFLDGDVPCRRYAGKILPDPVTGGDSLMAFADTGEDGQFGGYICDPIPLLLEDGRYRLDDSAGRE